MYTKRIVTILFLFLFLSVNNVYTQTHDWTRTNPGGGGAYSTVGASASGIIIAGSDLSGAYRSQDGGLTWDVIGVNKGLTETHISGVGFHRTDGNIIYIGTENGLFRSSNGGNSVTKVINDGYITDIEFGTNNTNVGYASYHPTYDSNQGVIYKTSNNGLAWSEASTGLPSGIRILKIVVNPDNANIAYALTGQGRFACGPADVFRTTNGGSSWTNTTSTIKEVMDVAIDPNDPDTVFITTMNADCASEFYWTDLDGDLYKSTDGGDTWGAPISNNTGVIWIDANNSNTIRLIDTREPWPWIPSSGTWTSTNGGSSFSKTGDVDNWDTFFNGDLFYCYSSSYNGICKTLGEDLSNKNNYFWVNYQWIFKTTDNGTTFNSVFTDEISTDFWQSRGFDNVNMSDISISKANKDIIYLGYFDIGIWRSLDRGMSWQSCNDVPHTGNWEGHGGNCATILADPSRSNVVWASLSGNQNGGATTTLLKNTNTGHRDNWMVSNTGLPDEEIMGLSIDVNSSSTNRTLFVTGLGDVYKSTNDGASWTMVHNCNGCRFTAVDESNSNVIYAGGEAGLWRSNNGGTSWVDVSHADMKASAGVGFWDGDYDGVFDVKIDPSNANWVYVTALGTGKGLYKSIDKGDTWEKLLTDDFMRKVAIVPQNASILYATSSSAFEAGGYDSNSMGVLFSDDGGANWTQQNMGMAYPFALAVAVDNTANPMVFVGSPGTGFQKAFVDNTALPVEYLSEFSASRQEEIVLLEWTTASEFNSDYFEIERSNDGRHWETISKIKAANQSKAYKEIDRSPIAPISYYRLKQIDFDKQFSYSNIASIAISDKNINTKLFPNPTKGLLNISTNRKINTIEIFNALGERLRFIRNPTRQIHMGGFASGVYFVKIQSGYSVTSHRVLVE